MAELSHAISRRGRKSDDLLGHNPAMLAVISVQTTEPTHPIIFSQAFITDEMLYLIDPLKRQAQGSSSKFLDTITDEGIVAVAQFESVMNG
jgi:hypothetical protein